MKRRGGGTNGDDSSPVTSPKTDELMKKRAQEGACKKVRCDGLSGKKGQERERVKRNAVTASPDKFNDQIRRLLDEFQTNEIS
jgi:hypothetical protein